jgi:RimJ/RimL family protein N-acetyltransferase
MTAPVSLPVGPPIGSTPAQFPGDVTLNGRTGTVERLRAARHGAGLIEALRGHDRVWTYLPPGPFPDDASLAAYIDACERNKERIFYAIVAEDGAAVGFLSLMEIRPAHRVVEVGNIIYSPALQRTPLGTEAQFLLMRYSFEALGYRRYEWKCDAFNAASRRAAERFGFTFEGTFRKHMIVKGRSRDTHWLSILDSEWPARKAAFERWLAPENFDRDGKQKSKLGA